MLAQLAVSERPIKWEKLASVSSWEGPPPEGLLAKGLLIELADGMWLHEALRERLLRDVGEVKSQRKAKLTD